VLLFCRPFENQGIEKTGKTDKLGWWFVVVEKYTDTYLKYRHWPSSKLGRWANINHRHSRRGLRAGKQLCSCPYVTSYGFIYETLKCFKVQYRLFFDLKNVKVVCAVVVVFPCCFFMECAWLLSVNMEWRSTMQSADCGMWHSPTTAGCSVHVYDGTLR